MSLYITLIRFTRPKSKTNLGLDLELNSIHFGIEISKCLGLKISNFFETSQINFFLNFA